MELLRLEMKSDRLQFTQALKNAYENLGEVNKRIDTVIAAGVELEQLLFPEGRPTKNPTDVEGPSSQA